MISRIKIRPYHYRFSDTGSRYYEFKLYEWDFDYIDGYSLVGKYSLDELERPNCVYIIDAYKMNESVDDCYRIFATEKAMSEKYLNELISILSSIGISIEVRKKFFGLYKTLLIKKSMYNDLLFLLKLYDNGFDISVDSKEIKRV